MEKRYQRRNTYRLISAEIQQETTGGFLTGDGDLVDLAGYGYAEIVQDRRITQRSTCRYL